MGERFYPNPNQYPEGENTGMSLDAYKAKKAAEKAAAEQQRRPQQGAPQSGYPRYEARPQQQPPQQAPQYGAPTSPAAPRNPQYHGPQQQQQAPRGPQAPQGQFPRQPQFQQPPQGQYPGQAEYQQQPPQGQPPRQANEMVHQPKPEGEKRKRFEFQWTRKRAIGAAVAAALAVGAPTLVASNAFGWRDMISGEGGASIAQDLNMEKIQLETLGTESLKNGQCDTPEAGLLTAYVSGEQPLVSMVGTVEDPTVAPIEEYMYEEKMGEADLKSSEEDKFEKFFTESHYPEATLEKLPLVLKVCQAEGASAVTEEEGALIVDRSLLNVKFEDPDSQWDRSIIKAVYQIEGAGDEYVETDPNKGQFVTLPNPENMMFLFKKEGTGDAEYDKAGTELMAAMATPLQNQIILAKMEADAIAQLDNVVDGHEGITYPDGATSLEETIDRALVKRLVGDKDVKLTFKGNYATQMDVAKDPATKQPITATPLTRLDSTVPFDIGEIIIEYGALSEPEIIEEPTPEPTETPVPTDAP